MELKLTVVSEDKSKYNSLKKLLERLPDLNIHVEHWKNNLSPGQIVFVDESIANLNDFLRKLDHGGKAVFLLTHDDSKVPDAVKDGLVDDVLITPFRFLEILSKLKQYYRILQWDEVGKINDSFSDLIHRFHDDLKLAERIQKTRLPVRFPVIKGFRVRNRYLAGAKSGGDFFDIAESRKSERISFILTDSSSYGLSSSVLSILMRVMMKLSVDDSRSSEETIKQVYSELLMTLSETDQLSLFYGVISRDDFRLRYLNLGTSMAFHAPKGRPFTALPPQGGAITHSSQLTPDSFKFDEGEVELKPADRLVLVSDGFINAAGGVQGSVELLNKQRDRESEELLNEFAYRVKSDLEDPDDLPAQDCTAVIMDIDSRILRMA